MDSCRRQLVPDTLLLAPDTVRNLDEDTDCPFVLDTAAGEGSFPVVQDIGCHSEEDSVLGIDWAAVLDIVLRELAAPLALGTVVEVDNCLVALDIDRLHLIDRDIGCHTEYQVHDSHRHRFLGSDHKEVVAVDRK